MKKMMIPFFLVVVGCSTQKPKILNSQNNILTKESVRSIASGDLQKVTVDVLHSGEPWDNFEGKMYYGFKENHDLVTVCSSEDLKSLGESSYGGQTSEKYNPEIINDILNLSLVTNKKVEISMQNAIRGDKCIYRATLSL